MNRNKERKYYIFTPANICTGGPEALHQLAYYMRLCGLNAYTVYYEYEGFVDAKPIDRYLQYDPQVVSYSQIEDQKENVFIAPENAPWCLNSIKRGKKCIWWLSLHADQVHEASNNTKLIYKKRRLFGQSIAYARDILFKPSKCLHLCASKYTFLEVSHRYPSSGIRYLVEPISRDFLQTSNSALPTADQRKDYVLYNPAKPSVRMTELLQRGAFEYVPLRGLAPMALEEMYRESKLYVDFGIFGGPERMPKEAVYYGCNIMVANHGAAANDWDVMIPNAYKVPDDEPVDMTEKRIGDMLLRYEEQRKDFEPFKQKVEQLETNFLQQIEEIFK